MIARTVGTQVTERLANYPAVALAGPRQCGKTTLARRAASKRDTFVTLDDDAILSVALDDPLGFVRHSKGVMIIDEIQKAPSLLLAIKQVVDADDRPGQFLVTGSADIRTLPAVADSLAGRISHIRLRTLTAGEISGVRSTFLTRAFQKDWPPQIRGYDKPAVLDMAFCGGYPEILRLAHDGRREWFEDYIKSLLSRDLRDIANIHRRDAMEALLNVLSAWSGKFMDTEAICGKLSITRRTFNSYVNALILLCLFEKVPPWIRTDYERVGRREKLFAADTGLMAHLLNWRISDVLLDSDRAGKIVETFVFNELSAQIDLDYHYSLSHYRDRENREIDFVVQNDAGGILGIEVKAGSAVSREDCRHMTWFKNNIAKDGHFVGVVLYTGETTLPLAKDIFAVPIAALWN